MVVSEGLSLSESRQPLNKSQFIAVKLAMKQDITLIQGPPGAFIFSRACVQFTRGAVTIMPLCTDGQNKIRTN